MNKNTRGAAQKAMPESTFYFSTPFEISMINAESLKSHLRTAVKGRYERVELRMNGTRLMDSSGLGVLLFLRLVLDGEGSVRLREPSSTVMQVLISTKTASLFEIIP
jgi:anti-anti-sigma factor